MWKKVSISKCKLRELKGQSVPVKKYFQWLEIGSQYHSAFKKDHGSLDQLLFLVLDHNINIHGKSDKSWISEDKESDTGKFWMSES